MAGYLAFLPDAVGNQLSVILVLLLTFIGIYGYTRRERHLPPGPLFVPLGLLRGRVSGPLEDLRREYGPIYSFRLGRLLTVVLSNATAVREALVDQADLFADRFHYRAVSGNAGEFRGSIIYSNGPEWKELRRMSASAMRSFGVGKRSLVSRINRESEHLLEAIAEKGGEYPFDPAHVIGNAVANIICSISFGQRFEYTDKKFQELLSVLHLLIHGAGAHGLFRYLFPYIVYLPCFRGNLERLRFIKEFIEGIVEEHRATLDPEDLRDIIDVFLLEADKEKDADGCTRVGVDVVWKTILDLFGAGYDTTTNSLLWAIAIFCHHPAVQDKMHKEITDLIGVDRPPSYEDRPKLPYTEAVLAEIQRYRPVVPLAVHRTTGDAVVGGYHIPKGSRVVINYLAVHNSPEAWEEPEVFRPERFLDDLGRGIHRGSHFPFGLGRRVCLGESLAKMELFLFLTSLVQRFRFFTPEGSPSPSLDGIRGITLTPRPYDVCAEARN